MIRKRGRVHVCIFKTYIFFQVFVGIVCSAFFLKENSSLFVYGYAYFWQNPLISMVAKYARGFLI